MNTQIALRQSGIERLGSPQTGFCYRLAEANRGLVDDSLLERIEALKIPPAWTDVRIACKPRARVQAIGVDTSGRVQYLYHPKFRERQERAKHARIVDFGQRLPAIRLATSQHLSARSLSRPRVMATMLRLVNSMFLRVGGERYAKEHNTYGICTLRKKHLTISGGQITFRYRGKWNKDQVHTLYDPRLARIVKDCAELPGAEIFKYYDDTGVLRDVTSRDFNMYVKEIIGRKFSAKDFRTWAGTLVAAWKLACLGPAAAKRQAERNVVAAIDVVAEVLGNTRAVARSAYVNPLVIDHYLAGNIIRNKANQISELLIIKTHALTHEEREVLKLLNK